MVVRGLSFSPKRFVPFLRTTKSSFNPVILQLNSSRTIASAKHERLCVRTTKRISDDGANDLSLAKKAFDVLARKSRSWQRLGTIVDLSLDESISYRDNDNPVKSICDVGTDHGLLATGLAMTCRFHHVLGVDVSNQALRNGALKLQDDILSYRNKKTSDGNDDDFKWNVEFRLSDGLQNVRAGEADVVCIAGMGVHTMVDILSERTIGMSPLKQQDLLLDKLGTQRILLQPTNSRPRLLMHLYTYLQSIGWQARIECIDFVSSRWYVTVEFERSNNSTVQIPGAIATATNTTSDWITHHRTWILSDAAKTGLMNRNDELWLEKFNVPM